jgi:succinoglycan biosynthesis transport protein ExoP
MSLQQFLLILRARYKLILAALVATIAITALTSIFLPKSYTAVASVLVDFKSTDSIGGIVLPVQILPGYLATQVDILKSQKVALSVVRRLKLAENPTVKETFMTATGGKGPIELWLAKLLLKKLDVKPARESSVINIEYTAEDAQFAAVVANAFARSYVETTLEMRVEPARATVTWFDERIKGLRASLESAQAKLSGYQNEKKIVSTDERLDVENARLSDLSTQLTAAQSVAIDSRSKELKLREVAAAGGGAEEFAEVMTQPVIIGLKSDLARLEAKLKDISGQYGINHPEYQQVLAQVNETRQRLNSETQNAAKALGNNNSINERRVNELRSSLNAQREKVLRLKEGRDEIALLMREVDGAQRAYDLAMQRLNQTTMESQMNQTNVTMLSPADEPSRPSSPNLPLNLIVSLLFGGVLGIGSALLVESLRPRVRSVAQLRHVLDAPVLALLPSERGRRRHKLRGGAARQSESRVAV